MPERIYTLTFVLTLTACGGTLTVPEEVSSTSPCTTNCNDDLGGGTADLASDAATSEPRTDAADKPDDAAMKPKTDAGTTKSPDAGKTESPDAGTTAPPAACAQTSTSYLIGPQEGFGYKSYGDYVVAADNWGGAPNQNMWLNSQNCWAVTTDATTEVYGIRTYPNTIRGWNNNATIMNALSSSGTSDWTTKAGMGTLVSQLTKAKVHWAFTAPTVGSRWDGLMDIYFHETATPAASAWPPYIDLQVIQSQQEVYYSIGTYYSVHAAQMHASTITIAGVQYLVYIDDPGATGFHTADGHLITMLRAPGPIPDKAGTPTWGVFDGVTDVDAIIKYFGQTTLLNDAKKPLLNGSGATVTGPLIPPTKAYLTAINAGYEIDYATDFTNRAFCVAMQDEPDCP